MAEYFLWGWPCLFWIAGFITTGGTGRQEKKQLEENDAQEQDVESKAYDEKQAIFSSLSVYVNQILWSSGCTSEIQARQEYGRIAHKQRYEIPSNVIDV